VNATDRRMLRISDMLDMIGRKPAGHFGYGCTDRRLLLAAMVRNHAELTALGFKPSTGEVLDPTKLPEQHCTDCGVQIPSVMRDGFGVLSLDTFPRCSIHAF
jgi:hypothetical protein